MTEDLFLLWLELREMPLVWLTVTLVVYQIGNWLYQKSNLHPAVNPVLISIAVMVALLHFSKTPYQTYFDGAKIIHFLLGPATVALAIPLYNQFHKVRQSFTAITVSIVAGSITAIVSAVGIAWLMGASRVTLLSLAPKSVTTPIAMGIAEQFGGLPSLAAVLVILTGILGAVFGNWMLARLGVGDERMQGLAVGVGAHGIGTARQMELSEVRGAFSGLAMGLNGLLTAILIPFLIGFVL